MANNLLLTFFSSFTSLMGRQAKILVINLDVPKSPKFMKIIKNILEKLNLHRFYID